ncbi:unnamed protein product [Cyclocybe aegerita]|uniref:Uncharacterized protein n=1 Tax=Cyclocybe aegerita TaxID=1973307 RepID=A0A8S0X201_CYCAE|nr:unnamed protein product [Cyclocybe aegerita]
MANEEHLQESLDMHELEQGASIEGHSNIDTDTPTVPSSATSRPRSPLYTLAAAHVTPRLLQTNARTSVLSPYTTSYPPPPPIFDVKLWLGIGVGVEVRELSVDGAGTCGHTRDTNHRKYERRCETQEGGGSYIHGYGSTSIFATYDSALTQESGYGYGYRQSQPMQPLPRYQALLTSTPMFAFRPFRPFFYLDPDLRTLSSSFRTLNSSVNPKFEVFG